MRAYDIIKDKRDGRELSREQIEFFVRGYTSGEIPDYQASALCMAIYFNGMSERETLDLTLAMRDSGAVVERTDGEIRVDKHSTGGVGDKTTLVVAPIVASLGVKVAKMSGRGLGHTGGTLDKLESISGLSIDLSVDKFNEIVNNVGFAIAGQTETLAPADKKLYALRDVTATVDSIPLIASSIMSKKLATGDDCIALDVKVGSGAFMKDEKSATELARAMVKIGNGAGVRTVALITDMDEPLGVSVGNSLEVVEAIQTLKGRGEKRFETLCVKLSAHLLSLATGKSMESSEKLCYEQIQNGKALEKFAQTVKAQGGNESWIYDETKFPTAKYSAEFIAEKDGYIGKTDAEKYGLCALTLGAGRAVKDDKIDYLAGIIIHKKRGDYVKKGESIATLYSSSDKFAPALEIIKSATKISKTAPNKPPIILGEIE